MKNFTLKSFALASTLLVGAGVSAQVPGFTKASWSDDLHNMHRTGFAIGDIDNDGDMDLYQSGVSGSGTDVLKGWNPCAFIYTNDNNQNFIPSTYERDTTTQILLSGLHPSTFPEGAFVDFNNDGLLDLYVARPYTGDLGWVGGYYASDDTRSATEVYINQGEGQFKLLESANLPALCHCCGKVNESQAGSFAFGDYDKDGYIDILMTGMELEHKRFVYLYKNLAGQGFEKQLVAHMKENDLYDLGLWVMGEAAEGEEPEPTDVPTMQFKPMSHGSVAFGDFNNDGWLDIITTGYSDDRGIDFRIYKNLQNGEFQDVTEDYALSNIYRAYENQLKLIDINKDGYLDIINLGTPEASERGDAEGRKIASILYNNGGEGGDPFTFTEVMEVETGLAPASASQIWMSDLNGDGTADLIYSGWNPDCGWNMFLAYYEEATGAFTIDNDFSHQGADDATVSCGFQVADCFKGYTLGDLNGDGYIDLIHGAWNDQWGGEVSVAVLNNGENSLSDAPYAPTNVKVSEKEGVVTVTWDDEENTEGLTYYNVQILNADNKLVSFTTSATENGKLTNYPEFATLLRSRSYSMTLPNGKYTVKVQAINHAYQSSEFTVVEADVNNSGVDKLEVANVVVKALANGILATGDENLAVNVYTVSGQLVATGVTNEVVPVNGNGVYVVKVANKAHKVVKF